MVVSRVSRVVNPKRRTRPRSSVRRGPAPARARNVHLLHLGFVNPKRRKPVAKRAKKKASSTRRHRTRPRTSNRRNPARRGYVAKRKNSFSKTHKRRNPGRMSMFGQPLKIQKVLEVGFGVAVGVGVNKAVLPMLPANFTSSNAMATAAAFAIAVAEWWAASFISPDFGAAVGLGGIAHAVSQGLNAFLPSVGAWTGMSGVRRGTGDFVSARLNEPYNPLLNPGVTLAPGPQLMSSGAYRRRSM